MKKLAKYIGVVILSLFLSTQGLAQKGNTKNQESYADRQLKCLAMNIYYEAGSESIEGKRAVAQVTINRTENERFPSDICGVVYQKTVYKHGKVCQFSWTCNKIAAPRNKYLWEESMKVAMEAMEDLKPHEYLAKMNALYFHERHLHLSWNKKKIVARIGNHIFYKAI